MAQKRFFWWTWSIIGSCIQCKRNPSTMTFIFRFQTFVDLPMESNGPNDFGALRGAKPQRIGDNAHFNCANTAARTRRTAVCRTYDKRRCASPCPCIDTGGGTNARAKVVAETVFHHLHPIQLRPHKLKPQALHLQNRCNSVQLSHVFARPLASRWPRKVRPFPCPGCPTQAEPRMRNQGQRRPNCGFINP